MKKTLVLWIDAITKGFITEENMPFLSSLIRKYGIGELKQSFGFTSIGASSLTGLNPNKHGKFTLYKKGDRKKLSLFKKLALKKNFYNNLKVKTLFDFLKENYIKFLYYDFPIIIDNNKTKLSFNLNNDKSRINKFLKLCKKDYEFYSLHLWDMDKYGHELGPKSFGYKNKLKEQDGLIKKIISNFDLTNDNIIIWSDHGMLNVNKILNLKSKLPKKEGYTYFLDSTMARFWFEDNNIKKEILEILKSIEEGHILTEKEKIKYKINFLHNEYGDEIFLMNSEVLILPNFFQKKFVRGMHGYDLSEKDELGIIIINKKFKKRAKIIDLLPTILDLIGIKYESLDGKSLL